MVSTSAIGRNSFYSDTDFVDRRPMKLSSSAFASGDFVASLST
jgi:hypothetical protein